VRAIITAVGFWICISFRSTLPSCLTGDTRGARGEEGGARGKEGGGRREEGGGRREEGGGRREEGMERQSSASNRSWCSHFALGQQHRGDARGEGRARVSAILGSGERPSFSAAACLAEGWSAGRSKTLAADDHSWKKSSPYRGTSTAGSSAHIKNQIKKLGCGGGSKAGREERAPAWSWRRRPGVVFRAVEMGGAVRTLVSLRSARGERGGRRRALAPVVAIRHSN